MWMDIHSKDKEITPWYYFEFDKLNELGFPDTYIFDFMREMEVMAKKEIKERLNLKYAQSKRIFAGDSSTPLDRNHQEKR